MGPCGLSIRKTNTGSAWASTIGNCSSALVRCCHLFSKSYATTIFFIIHHFDIYTLTALLTRQGRLGKVNILVVQLVDVNIGHVGAWEDLCVLSCYQHKSQIFFIISLICPQWQWCNSVIAIMSSESGEWQALHRVICHCFDQLTTVSVNSNKNIIRGKWISGDLKEPRLIENLDNDFLRADNFVISPKTKWDIFRGCFKIKFDELPL